MKLLFLGDIVGKNGRNLVIQELTSIRKSLNIDCVIANAENASHGFGLSKNHFNKLIESGIDLITLGNHSWDNTDMIALIKTTPQIIRPHNYPSSQPGSGVGVALGRNGEKVLVVQVAGMISMMPGTASPFDTLDQEINNSKPGEDAFDAVVVDIHAELTAEKNALALFIDGRASLVVGTHTHIPTADHRILPNGTAYITDVGMCGPYESVIGFDHDISIQRQMGIIPKPRLKVSEKEATICGVVVDTCPKSGLATDIKPIRIGGSLQSIFPKYS